MQREIPPLWFPFTAGEIQIALGVFGFIASTLSFGGADQQTLALASCGFVVVTYLSGLLVYSRRAGYTFRFVQDGALRGHGYLEHVREAKHSLLLIHADDDSPSEELLLEYSRLLDKGVELRRIIVQRSIQPMAAWEWVTQFGDHERLEHRLIDQALGEVVRLSFVVVDEEVVILSVPSGSPALGEPYAEGLLFSHLLVVRDRSAAEAFVQAHSQLWRRAKPVTPHDLHRSA